MDFVKQANEVLGEFVQRLLSLEVSLILVDVDSLKNSFTSSIVTLAAIAEVEAVTAFLIASLIRFGEVVDVDDSSFSDFFFAGVLLVCELTVECVDEELSLIHI